MDGCLFCDIQKGLPPPVGGPVYEDDLVYAHHYSDGSGLEYLGHLLVETKRHAPDFASLNQDEAQAIGLLIRRLSSALKSSAGAEKVYVVFYGEVTPHLHVHITARYPDTPAQYLRWNVEDWPAAPRGNLDEVAALCEKLRATLVKEHV